jgi:transcriptional regulator with XRE-family HTH domain
MVLTALQCRMARAALELGVRELAEIADVSPNTIARLERGDRLHPRTLNYITGALEGEGVLLIAARAVSAQGGVGVRLGADGPKSSFGRLFEAIWNLPDLRAESEAGYAALLDIFDQYLDIIQSEHRQPDVWERLDLNDAVKALDLFAIFAASAYLRHAITPPDDQAPDYPISAEDAASTAKLDLAYFRRCVSGLRARGYRPPGRVEPTASNVS